VYRQKKTKNVTRLLITGFRFSSEWYFSLDNRNDGFYRTQPRDGARRQSFHTEGAGKGGIKNTQGGGGVGQKKNGFSRSLRELRMTLWELIPAPVSSTGQAALE
jgi:hypothetical protein